MRLVVLAFGLTGSFFSPGLQHMPTLLGIPLIVCYLPPVPYLQVRILWRLASAFRGSIYVYDEEIR